MDAFSFHELSTMPKPALPSATAAQLADSNDKQLMDHARAIAQWLPGLFMELSETRALKAHMDVTVQFNAVALPGAQTIVALGGPNGAGKSTLSHQWAMQFYRRQVEPFPLAGRLHRWEPEQGRSANVVPVVWVNLQARAKIAELDAQILRFLGRGVSGSIRDLTMRVVQAITDHRVQALVIDDVHLLNTKYQDGRDVLDHLKHLNTELGERGGTMIMIGANLQDTPMYADPQIASRMRFLQLRPVTVDDPAGKERWKLLLREIEHTLSPAFPGTDPGMLQAHAPLMHRLTGGYLGELTNLVKNASLAALMTGSGLTEQLLLSTPRSVRGTDQIANPRR